MIYIFDFHYSDKSGILEFLDSGRKSSTLDSGPWTLLLTVVEQNQNPVSDFS